MLCAKRLRKEQQGLERDADPLIQLCASPDSILDWSALVAGPSGSVYEGFRFRLSIRVGADYPHSPPTIAFATRVFHPNVAFESGEICLDILKREWSPAWTLQSACRAIMLLLEAPEADSPLNCDAGNMVRAGDARAYRSTARMYCAQLALRDT